MLDYYREANVSGEITVPDAQERTAETEEIADARD